MKRCATCGREMRPHGVSKADAPHTVATGTAGTCASCTGRAGGAPADAQVEDSPCILVRCDLRPSTYQALARFAKENGTTVGAVLSVLADRAVTGVPKRAPEPAEPPAPRRPPTRITDELDDRIRMLNASGLSDNKIAAQVGLAQTTVSKRRALMGLNPPTPRVGGRQRAS